MPFVANETRWIEAEALHSGDGGDKEDDDDDDRRNQSEKNNDDVDEVVEMSDLFADPDPYETFQYQWTLPIHSQNSISGIGMNKDANSHFNDVDGDDIGHQQATNGTTASTTTTRTIELSVTGHKAENGQTLHSTGLTVWRASTILADWLIGQQEKHEHQVASGDVNIDRCCIVKDKTVLELGAGLGIPGMVCYKLGASVTILTDGDTDTLTNLRTNVVQNCGCCPTAIATMSGTSPDEPPIPRESIILCHQLIWGNMTNIQTIRQALSDAITATVRPMLHSNPTNEDELPNFDDRSSRTFDVILGSDIIYVDHVVQPLFETVKQLLCPTNGLFLLAFCRRNVSITYVLDIASQTGFMWTPPDKPDGVYIFRIETSNST